MSAERLQFSHLQRLYSEWSYNSESCEAVLEVHNSEIADALELALSDAYRDDSGLTLLDGNLVPPLVGKRFRLAVQSPRIGLGLFAPSVAALLQHPGARVKEPSRYFVDRQTSQPEALAKYRDVLRLVSVLREAAAFLDEVQAELVFVSKGKFAIPVVYNATDLDALDVSALNGLIEAFAGDLHRDQKLAILAEVVVEMVANQQPCDRFRTLLLDIPKLLERVQRGYRLFASSFSYEKIRNEVEEARVKYTAKIHDVLSAIQNQMLGIPVATIVVATQIKSTEVMDAIFWGNLSVVVGCWIFVILADTLIRNQAKTLDVLSDEIERQNSVLHKQYSDCAELMEDVFNSLNDRVERQRLNLRWVRFVLAVGVILANLIWIALTGPVAALFLSVTARIQGFA